MRIDSLHIEAAPGLPDGVPELELGPGLTVIVGPNASGKSTLARVLREMLWPELKSSGARVRSHWQMAGGAHTAECFAGRVHWQPPLAATIPPGAAGLARFGIQSLLKDDDTDDQKLGQRVARELAGNLDLTAAARQFDRSERLRKNTGIAKEREEARIGLYKAKRHTTTLAAKENQLSELAAQIEEAEVAGRCKAAAEFLHELVVAAEKVSQLEGKPYAPGLDQLVGDESERAQEFHAELEKQNSALTNLENKLTELAATERDNAFPGEPPARQELDAWTTRLGDLAATDRKLVELRLEVASAEQRLDDQRAGVLAEGASHDLTASILNELAQGIGKLRDARAELKTHGGTVATWESWAQGADQDSDSLRDVISHLRAWLRSPEAGAADIEASTPAGLSWALVVAGLLFLATAVAISFPWLSAGLLVSGVGATLLWSARRRGAAFVDGNARATFQQAAERTPHAPKTWRVAVVEEHLTELQKDLVKIEQACRAADQLQEAHRSVAKAEQELDEQAEVLRKLAARVGASESFMELGAVAQVHALIEWLDGRAAHAKLCTDLEQVASLVAKELSSFTSWLPAQGCTAPSDVAAARAALVDLGHRRTDLLEARGQTKAAQGDRSDCVAALAKAETECNDLWKRAKVEHGDLAALALRLEERKGWAENQKDLANAQTAVESCRVRFARAAELPQLEGAEPESVTAEQVTAWIESLTETAEGLGDLNKSAGGIKRELELAAEGHDLEDKLAAKLEREQAVADERERAVVDALARGLLSEAREHHETAHAPPTLKRAQEHFASFTHNGWRLEVGTDDAFRAHDLGTGESRSLAELSDGTRAQLLLAVRLAALEELEHKGEPVPVCLDEALSIADPVRFRAIASALLELADDGRQILYFTADPGEAAQWEQVCADLDRPAPRIVDLAVLRGAPVDWGGIIPALPPKPKDVPDPAGRTAEEYARLVDVPTPDGFRAIISWHVYVIAHDDLDALAACLRHHITTIGHWREACRRELRPAEIPADIAQRLSARADLAEALAASWRIGRGRPVTWEDVEASDAVSASFEDRVRDLLAEHAGDSRRFATMLGDLPRFKARAETLTAYLEQVGCLPLVEVLSSADLVRHSLQTAADATDLLGPEQAATFVTWLAELLRA